MDSTKVPFDVISEPFHAYCDADEIAAFALAINDNNSRYQAGTAIPPTYAVVPAFNAFLSTAALPAEVTAGGRGGGHGEHDLYIHKPITPGMMLHTTAQKWSAVVSKAGMNVFTRLVSTDDAGETVIEQYWSIMNLGDVTGGTSGQLMADHSFPEDARERLVQTVTLPTTRDQTFRYAGASGDRAVIHVSDKAAQGMGQKHKFNQGLCSLGISSKALVDVAADGDASRIRRVAVRFARYAFPGDDIIVSIYDAGQTDDGAKKYAFEAEAGGQAVLRHGLIEVTG